MRPVEGKKVISMEECEEAIDRVLMGPERKRRILTEQDREVFAYHEAGHAVVAHFLEHCDPVHKVTIVGRGQAGGYTMMLPEEERAVRTRAELEDIIANMLGGRAAEEIKYNRDKVTTGAQNDLERVTKLARTMITEWGMNEDLGLLTFGSSRGENVFLGRDFGRERDYSEEVAAQIDREVRALIERGHQRARDILEKHWDKVELVVKYLLEKETINRDEFERLMNEGEQAEVNEGGAAAAGITEASGDTQRTVTGDAAKESGAPEGLGLKKAPKPAMGLE